jgi:hypothetical protein
LREQKSERDQIGGDRPLAHLGGQGAHQANAHQTEQPGQREHRPDQIQIAPRPHPLFGEGIKRPRGQQGKRLPEQMAEIAQIDLGQILGVAHRIAQKMSVGQQRDQHIHGAEQGVTRPAFG